MARSRRYISIIERTGDQEPVYTAGEAAHAEFSVAEIDASLNETPAKAERLSALRGAAAGRLRRR